jgi:hypothetical protein
MARLIAPAAGPSSAEMPIIQHSVLQLYQLFDVSDSIDLEAARSRLAEPSTRIRPVQTRGASIDIPQLPLEISMGAVALDLNGVPLSGQMYARVYDLGILSFRLALAMPSPLPWDSATDYLAAVQTYPPAVLDAFQHALERLQGALSGSIETPNATVQTEDYTILVIAALQDDTPASQLAQHPALLQTALGERRPLSPAAANLATTLSYYADDLILLTWAAALVIDPDATAREDASFLLEFANVQLLAFRSYDAQVEADLARITPQLARYRRPRWPLSNATARFLYEIHSLIAYTTDTSARAENALKVTEDVYWNRVYMAALNVLRVDAWRTGITEGLDVLRHTAERLNDEVEATRQSLLEILVIVLILLELVVALAGLRH